MPVSTFTNSLVAGLFVLFSLIKANPLEYAKPKLSDYGFFREPMAEQIPADNIFPYKISTPLFTDLTLSPDLLFFRMEKKSATSAPKNLIFRWGLFL